MKNNKSSLFLCLLFLLLPAHSAAEVTLEILDLNFPKTCGASWNEDINSCSQCHSKQPATVKEDDLQEMKESAAVPHRDIVSLEENDRISISVPDAELTSDQPFTQQFNFHGSQIMYVYGYHKYGENLQILDTKLIPNHSNHFYLEKHDGKSLPLLSEAGEYIFVLKLLHNRKIDFQNRSRWEEVVLIWTLSVSEKSEG